MIIVQFSVNELVNIVTGLETSFGFGGEVLVNLSLLVIFAIIDVQCSDLVFGFVAEVPLNFHLIVTFARDQIWDKSSLISSLQLS